MNLSAICVVLGCLEAVAVSARGELRLVPEMEPQSVFAGPGRMFKLTWENTGNQAAGVDLTLHLLQTSSSTATATGDTPWKRLEVLPGQTVIEHASLDLPEVRAETRFMVQWREGTNRLFGTTELLVYPTNLLKELKPLAGEELPVGLFDPNNMLKPLLKTLSIEFDDLEDSGIADFRGKLAVVGPFTSRDRLPGDLRERIEKLARKGSAVVWLLPPPAPRAKVQPAFQSVPVGPGTVVLVQATFIVDLTNDPRSQLNLIHCCRLARNPVAPRLPTSAELTPGGTEHEAE